MIAAASSTAVGFTLSSGGANIAGIPPQASTMKYFLCAIVLLFSIANSPAAVINAVSASRNDVATAITAAANGDTVRLPAGQSASWSSSITFTKGITLDLNGCTITRNMAGVNGPLITATAVNGFATRITGGTFNGGGTGTGFQPRYIRFDSTLNGTFRLDHCTFHDAGGRVSMVETFHQSGQSLIDHCTFYVSVPHEIIHQSGYAVNSLTGWDYTVNEGSYDAAYIEDCTFIWQGGSSTAANACMQTYYGSRTVFRYNEIYGALWDVHGDPTPHAGRWYEIYENDFYIATDTSRLFQLRGGSGVLFNNRLHNLPGATGGRNILFWNEVAGNPAPCQVGRGKNVTPGNHSNQASAPIYVWNNSVLDEGGGTSGMQFETQYTGSATVGAIQTPRDYIWGTPKPGYTAAAYPHPLQGAIATAPTLPTITLPNPASTYYVDKDNPAAADNASQAGSQAAPFATINYALTRIVSGDEILVKQSSATPYDVTTGGAAGLFIRGPSGVAGNPCAIRAFPGHSPRLTGGGASFLTVIALTGVSYWEIEGLEMSNGGFIALVRNGANNITFRNNYLHDSGNQIVHVVNNSSNVLFEGNTLRNGGSLGSQNGEGFYIGTHNGNDFTNNVTIRNNTIDTMKHEGIEFKHDTHDCTAEENTISNCVANYDYGKYSILAFPTATYGSNPNHIIRRNVIFNHGGAGTGAAIGVQTGAQVYNNVIYSVASPAYALEIAGGDSYTRYVWHNTFDIPEARAIHNLGGALSIGNNIGPSTNGNFAFNSSFFLNSANHDYHLVAASAPVDAGGTVPFQLADDFDGVARVAPFDIGAFEYSAPTATPSSLSWKSTQGVIQAPFVKNGNSISQTSTTFDPSQGGEALYNFNVTAAGDYTVSVVVDAPDHAANSLFVNIDSQPSNPAMIWDIPPSSGFIERVVSWRGNGTDTNNEFTPKKFSLSAGSHQLIIRGREANVQIRRITVGPAAPSAPSNLGIVGQ